MKRTFNMLANDFDPLKYKADGSFLSEKYDGVRALWLPWTRGIDIANIPFANRLRDKRQYVCSGLWTRKAKVIVSPDWFLDALPGDMPLDGELFMGRGLFQKTSGAVRRLTPLETDWRAITYMIFDIPSYQQHMLPGLCREGGKAGDPAYECWFKPNWASEFGLNKSPLWMPRRFNENVSKLAGYTWKDSSIVREVSQVQLPHSRVDAETIVAERLRQVVAVGGEGVMLRRPHSIWEPNRSKDLVKVKPLDDDEAVVIGYVMGEGKLDSMIGAVRVRWTNKEGKEIDLDLSGFTERERMIDNAAIFKPGDLVPGKFLTQRLSSKFPIGFRLTFEYSGLTEAGVPRIARYKRPAE